MSLDKFTEESRCSLLLKVSTSSFVSLDKSPLVSDAWAMLIAQYRYYYNINYTLISKHEMI